jgi:hypothetical protein
MASIVLSHVEPDPEVEWGEATIDGLRDRLRSGDDFLEEPIPPTS